MKWNATRRSDPAVLVAVTAICVGELALAQTPPCDALTPEQQQAKQAVFAALHPYDGCDATFEQCLAKKPVSPVVLRLASDICRQVKAGRGKQEIEHGLAKRAQSALAMGKPSAIAIDSGTLAGDPQAPVQVVVYACVRCPYCRVVIPILHREVTEGSLKGKARLYFRQFPLKDHQGSTEGGLALVAASRLGGFWPYMLKIYERYDVYCPKLLPDWAAETGLDKAALEGLVADPKTREFLVASKQEGIRNKVTATPTLFIDGHKYLYDMQSEVIIDVLHEVYEARSAAK
ncbi:MAG: thioredoxin domain-containing protein [Deltaproteobacteria bacterium]|nr:thioredoxin domain-containing protein [Deltaproteobacteria bacterium]